jgi:hypothetical protein
MGGNELIVPIDQLDVFQPLGIYWSLYILVALLHHHCFPRFLISRSIFSAWPW